MVCPACSFGHFEAVNQTFRAGITAGAPLLEPSGYKLMCSKCGSLLRLTADVGLKLVIEAKAKDAESSESGESENGDMPDSDARLPRWQRRRAQAGRVT